MLLIDGVKYEEWTPPLETEFERIVKEHAKEIFGKESIYFDLKKKLVTKAGIGSIPDGYVITLQRNPVWYICEVELSTHPLYDHVVPQITKFIKGIKSFETQRDIINAIDAEIAGDTSKKTFIFNKIGSNEIYRFLINLISQQPRLALIIDKNTKELEEMCEDLPIETKVIEFRTFSKDTISLTVHAHLFDSLDEKPRPLKPRGDRYLVPTAKLLTKYGNRPSNVPGMTWQQLWDSDTDGNSRYFKVRLPLIELDKKETGKIE